MVNTVTHETLPSTGLDTSHASMMRTPTFSSFQVSPVDSDWEIVSETLRFAGTGNAILDRDSDHDSREMHHGPLGLTVTVPLRLARAQPAWPDLVQDSD